MDGNFQKQKMLWIAFAGRISNYFGYSYTLYERSPSIRRFWRNLCTAYQHGFWESDGGAAGFL